MKTLSFFYIIIAGVLWGTSGLFSHALTPYGFTPLHLAAVRGTVSFLLMATFLLIRRRTAFHLPKSALLLCAGCGLMLFGTSSAYYASMSLTSVSTAVVLMYTAPVLVMIFSISFLGERLTRLKLLSVGCMLAGCLLVSGVIGGMKFDLLGVLMGLLSGVTFATYNILTKVEMQRGYDPVSTSLYGYLFMGLFGLCASHPQSMPASIAKAPALTLPLLIGLGLFTVLIPYFLYTLALRDLPAGTASALSIVEPMSATVFSILFLKERLTRLSAIGMLLILLAVFLLSRAESGIHQKRKDSPTS